MRFFTAHTRMNRPPVLLVEGFRWGAFLFGPLWFLWHRAFLAAVIAAACDVIIAAATGGVLRAVLLVGFAGLLGLVANDCRRLILAQAGFALSEVVAARDRDAALARLLERRPELRASFR